MNRPRCIPLLAALAAALLLSACGGGQGASEPPATTVAGEPSLTPATAGLTIDEAAPGGALQRFVDAAATGEATALWPLLSSGSRERLGPTVDDFAARFGTEFREGVGAFAGTDYEVVLSRRDERGFGVAAIAGNRIREGREEFAVYGAAFRLEGGRWRIELGAEIELTHLVDAPPDTIQVQVAADAAIEGAGLWVDGEPVLARVEGTRSELVIEGRRPDGLPANPVAVTFARTATSAAAGAFTLDSEPEAGDAPSY